MTHKWMIMAFNLGSPLVMHPISGTLVRWRAHYNPRREPNRATEAQQQQEAETNSPVKGFLSILRRVYVVEGLMGFYKGLVPRMLGFLCITGLMFLRFKLLPPWDSRSGSESKAIPDITITGSAIDMSYRLLLLVIEIPAEILVNRATTTQYKLPWISRDKASKALLSEYERRSLWRLYSIPGYSAARIIMVVFSVGVWPVARVLLLSVRGPEGNFPLYERGMIPLVLLNILLALVMAPLQVACVRLSLQRYRDPDSASESGTGSGGSGEQVPGLEKYPEGGVVRLKDTDRFPYTGLVDCLDTIIKEEGWKTLLKTGWLAFFGL
ncbi:hypothetical protein V5O48_005455 [Marasmius crinis-equi]|uniref:Mitochondrial carrier n=1 Tax=Marasmius crinis-equi TaxID=585013 RepID=A0ABR3FM92_9AGAR